MTSPARKRPQSNRDLWATSEFVEWSTERGLLEIERSLIDHYFAKDGDTLDAGTGGGRVLHALRHEGFTSLTGFDYLPEMVDAAHAADPEGKIRFDVEEATKLDYATDSFDQVIYIRLMGSLDVEGGPAAALREAHRVLRGPGVALVSFLWWEPRKSHILVRVTGPWLRVLRALRRTDRGERDWPWFRFGQRPHFGALLDRGPYLHWFTTAEAHDLLKATGFSIVFSGGQTDLVSVTGSADPGREHPEGPPTGELYVVCTKA